MIFDIRDYIQIAASLFGTLGFCIMFRVNPKKIWAPTLSGALCWALFLILRNVLEFGVFASTYFSAALAGILGVIFSRILKAPTTVFFIPACIPLIPGSNLYYAAEGLLSSDTAAFGRNAVLLALYTAGIALGLGSVLELENIIVKLNVKIREKKVRKA